ncbi:hypothetical protein INR49_029097 [Caranx melampygus]|nr:hypothetical protein INR49_029097 [Caranx melampygus]
MQEQHEATKGRGTGQRGFKYKCDVRIPWSPRQFSQRERESRGVHLHAKSPSKEVYPCVHLSVHGTPRLSPDFFILCFPVPLSPRRRSFEGQ